MNKRPCWYPHAHPQPSPDLPNSSQPRERPATHELTSTFLRPVFYQTSSNSHQCFKICWEAWLIWEKGGLEISPVGNGGAKHGPYEKVVITEIIFIIIRQITSSQIMSPF